MRWTPFFKIARASDNDFLNKKNEYRYFHIYVDSYTLLSSFSIFHNDIENISIEKRTLSGERRIQIITEHEHVIAIFISHFCVLLIFLLFAQSRELSYKLVVFSKHITHFFVFQA